MSFKNNEKQTRVEIKRRIGDRNNLVGGLIWEADWTDITDYLSERLSAVENSLDDVTLQGKLEQSSVQLRFNNETGKFNPAGTEGSLWSSSQYVFHTRIRYYEFSVDQEQLSPGDEPDILPLLDGLIAGEFRYRNGHVCDVQINSKLDILREHYILENIIGRTKRIASQAIVRHVIDLFNDTYPELGITTTGGLFRNEIIYDNITPFSNNVLDLVNTTILDGGGIGGLLRDNTLFFTYFGNTVATTGPMADDGDTIGLWLFDATDFLTPTSARDQSTNSNDLTVINTLSTSWQDGFFTKSARAWYADVSGQYAGLGDYTLEMLIKIDINRLPEKSAAVVLQVLTQEVGDVMFYPLFAWTELTSADERHVKRDPVGAGTYYNFEGFFVNERCELIFVKGHFVEGAPFVNGAVVADDIQKLADLQSEGFYQYIAVGFDLSQKSFTTYLNGTEQSLV